MSYFTSLERIENGLNDFFVFKAPEKEVKRGLHDASVHNVDFLRARKETWNGLGPLILDFNERDKVS